MGGNVSIEGCPTPEPIHAEERHTVHEAIKFLYGEATGRDVRNSMFSGSTALLFNPMISTEDLTGFKPSFGDIDLIADVDHKDGIIEQLYDMADRDEGKDTEPFYLIKGIKRHGSEVSLVILVTDLDNKPIQVDFEFKPFESVVLPSDGPPTIAVREPSEFSQFSQSAPLKDALRDIPGVYHKQLVMALTAAETGNDVVRYKRRGGRLEYLEETNTRYKFSVSKGLRKTLVVDPETGDTHHPDTKTAYYITDVPTIARALLHITDPFFEKPEWALSSFISICNYINNRWDEGRVSAVADDFYSRVMGEKNRINRPEDEKRKVMAKLCELLTILPNEPSEPLSV